MQSFRRAPEDRAREGSAAAQPRDAMPAAGHRPRRSASMPFHGAGAAKGRDPSPAPAAGGRARLRDEQLRQLRELFLRFDLDRDGSLTLLELAALLRSLGLRPAAGDEIHALIAAMDADGNGTVEFNELASTLAPLLLGPCRRPSAARAVAARGCGDARGSSFGRRRSRQ